MKSQILYRRAEHRDYDGMLALQKANFIGNLTEAGKRDGFLSIEYREQELEEINNDLGIVVALHNGAVVGYLCGTTFEYSARFPILACLMKNVSGRTIKDKAVQAETTFVYGPVCVGSSYRGTGILSGLFETIKTITHPRYDSCVLFISDRNQRSLIAHSGKLGMQSLGTFEFDARLFHMLGASVSPQ